MKLRALAIMTMVGLCSASLAYADPTDDMTGTGANGPTAPGANIGSASGNDMPAGPTGPQANNDMGGSTAPNTSATPSDPSNSNDDMSADTATGDDDY